MKGDGVVVKQSGKYYKGAVCVWSISLRLDLLSMSVDDASALLLEEHHVESVD